jgi:hypothetical protein
MITVEQREKLEALIEDLVIAEIENSKGSSWYSREQILLAERALSNAFDGITEEAKC